MFTVTISTSDVEEAQFPQLLAELNKGRIKGDQFNNIPEWVSNNALVNIQTLLDSIKERSNVNLSKALKGASDVQIQQIEQILGITGAGEAVPAPAEPAPDVQP